MNILYVIETGGPGGAEQAFLSTLLAVRKEGHNCTAVTFRSGWLTKKLEEHDITFHTIRNTSSRISCIIELFTLIRQYRIDIVHSHLMDSNLYASVAARLSGVPHIGTEHGDVHHSTTRRFTWLKTRIISALTRRILAVSEFTRTALVNSGMNPEKTRVLGNPFDFSIPLKSPVSKSTRSEYPGVPSVSDSDWLWIHVANLRPVKDQFTLLQGFAKARSRLTHNQYLLIAGDGDLRKQLEGEALSLEISSHVIFLGFREDISTLMTLCDGFILSSLSEATPLSILEAARSKLVLLATNTGGIPELVIDNETGYLFPKSSPDELAEKIDFVINNQTAAKQTAESAHIFIREKSDIHRITSALLEEYSSLIKKP